jgi:hypothetical protein
MVFASDLSGVEGTRVLSLEDEDGGMVTEAATIVDERSDNWEEERGSVSRLRFLSGRGVVWFSLSFSGWHSSGGEVPPIGGGYADSNLS